MILNISLLRLSGAEIVSKGSVPGVFIPIPYNGFVARNKKSGKISDIYLRYNLHRSGARYKHKQFGTIIRPEGAKDLLLQSDELGCKKLEDIGAWIFDSSSTKMEEIMSGLDFDEIIK